MKTACFRLLLVLCVIIFLPSTSHTGDQQSILPYSTIPSFSTDPFFPGQSGGDFGTGLALADINNDGYKDMVVSSGNDKALQHVAVYLNQKNNTFSKTPDWLSGDTDHHGLLAVGDIDGNGYIDVAVSVFLGKELQYEKGGVKVYYNHGGTLDSLPTFTDTGYPSFGCALGDIDGDGDLDLAVACGEPIPEVESFATQECSTGPTARKHGTHTGKQSDNPQPPFKTHNRIYLNRNGSFSTQTGDIWKTADSFVAMTVTYGDVNADGLMDVLYDSAPLRLYLGKPGTLPDPSPSWTSEDENYYGNGIDFAPTIHQGKQPDTVATIAASSNSYMGKGRGGFSLYRFLDPFVIQYEPRTSLPIWTSKYGGWGSAIRLADLNRDGNLDLVTHRWNTPGRNELAGTLLVYLGNGATYPDTWDWSSSAQYTSIIEAIDLADLDKKGIITGEYATTIDGANWGTDQEWQSMVYVSPLVINKILIVKRWNQAAGWQQLQPGKDYTSIPGRGWVSFATPLRKNDKVHITFAISPELDIVYTNWNCDKGNYVYDYRPAAKE